MNTISIIALLFCVALLTSAAALGFDANWFTVLGAAGCGFLLRGALE
jgi:hypothetical protein